ncbi:protein regulator of cytokinesis 1 isoform X1 [Bombina bombina]|uniref:protein regulator of cytokinesis 1 isoform X1 n=1 Tax=Bombina bombina TaxID=8345 RepID=UPI00235AC837|nr:protein regulator of cytokinesis 1 isoform X1 [Bombina bombina]
MVYEETTMRDRLKKSIECCLKELRILCHELSLEACTVDESMTILEIERDLRVKLELLTSKKNERLQELRVLQQKDQELCSDLCATPYYIPSGSVPSLKQLEELKEHIKARSEEKKERLHVFSSLREEIRLCFEEMGRQPENSLESEAICEDEDAFFLTLDNIKALKAIKQQLEFKKECLISTLNTIKERVQVLWHRLQVPQEEQDLYLKAAKCPINEDIKQWDKELVRLEELKKSNLKMVILKAREEIQIYWDKCCFSAEQRNAFAPYWSDDYTEDMLSQHDEEVVRIKLHYEKSKEMLDAVNKWETSWEKFLVLEKRASDPNRFSNRGGTLLKEEKERVKLQKLLKKLEEELKTRVEAWEAEQGCEFLLKGNRFMDYISSQWEVLKREKEREKQERTLKKDENSTPFKTPVKRPAGSCMQNTPSSKNRKLNGTNAIMSRTVSHNNVASASQTINVKTPLPTIKEEIAKKSNYEAIFNSTINENL